MMRSCWPQITRLGMPAGQGIARCCRQGKRRRQWLASAARTPSRRLYLRMSSIIWRLTSDGSAKSFSSRLQIPRGNGGDEAVDVVDVDLRPETGARRSASATSPGRARCSATSMAMAPPSEWPTRCALSMPSASMKATTVLGETRDRASSSDFARLAMARQIERIDGARSARASILNSQLSRSPPKPWMRMTFSAPCRVWHSAACPPALRRIRSAAPVILLVVLGGRRHIGRRHSRRSPRRAPTHRR